MVTFLDPNEFECPDHAHVVVVPSYGSHGSDNFTHEALRFDLVDQSSSHSCLVGNSFSIYTTVLTEVVDDSDDLLLPGLSLFRNSHIQKVTCDGTRNIRGRPCD